MKASQVLEEYKKGKRDFKGVSLRGQSFVKQDLSGADFSETDIRGANFSRANLTGTNFQEATAGLQRRWLVVRWVLAFLMSGLSGTMALYSVFLAVLGIESIENVPEKLAAAIFLAFFLIVIFFALARQGFTVRAVSWIAGAFAGAVAGAFAVAVAVAGAVGIGIAVVAFAGAVAIAFAGAVAVAGAGGSLGFTFGAGVGILTPFSLYVASRAMKGDEKFAIVRQFAIAFGSLGGTRFYCATLTDANFTAATLENCNFRDATLTRTCWKDTKKLDRARPGTTYLNYPHIRELVTTGEGEKGNFDRLNLRGVNLQGANLAEASFILADLSDANLQDTILSHSKLVQTQLDRTDLTGATLTGAYIEDWGITAETRLDGIRCEYVYRRLPPNDRPPFLQLPPSERLDRDPHREPRDQNKTFEDGDFSDFITPLKQTLDLYHNRPEDLRLVALAFQKLRDENPDADLELVSFEKKGKNRDKLLLRVETAPNADKSSLHKGYFNHLDELKSLSPEALCTLLAERKETIQMLSRLLESKLQSPQVSVPGTQFTQTYQFMAENQTMNNKTDNNRQGDTYTQSGKFGVGHMSGGKIQSGAKVAGELHETQPKTLAESAVEIQQLLQILDRSYPPNIPVDTQAEIDVAVKGIAKNPALKERIIGALKLGGIEALKEFMDNPYVNILLATYQGWQNPE